MKTNLSRDNRTVSVALAAVVSAFLIAGTISASAYNGYGNGNGYNNQAGYNNGYHNNPNGYYNHGHYYPYTYHNHHRGYWNQGNSGTRIWISI